MELLYYIIEEILFQESDLQIVHFVKGRKIRSIDQLVGIANKCNNYEHIYFLDGEQLTPMFPQFVGCLTQFKHYKTYLDSQEKCGKFKDWKSLMNKDFCIFQACILPDILERHARQNLLEKSESVLLNALKPQLISPLIVKSKYDFMQDRI